MSLEIDEITKILNKIGDELSTQISLANHNNGKIDKKNLIQKTHDLDKIITTSRLSDEDRLMLQKFSSTLVHDDATIKSLRYEKQDLQRVLANLNDI